MRHAGCQSRDRTTEWDEYLLISSISICAAARLSARHRICRCERAGVSSSITINLPEDARDAAAEQGARARESHSHCQRKVSLIREKAEVIYLSRSFSIHVELIVERVSANGARSAQTVQIKTTTTTTGRAMTTVPLLLTTNGKQVRHMKKKPRRKRKAHIFL